jgi:hypothetical protein
LPGVGRLGTKICTTESIGIRSVLNDRTDDRPQLIKGEIVDLSGTQLKPPFTIDYSNSIAKVIG